MNAPATGTHYKSMYDKDYLGSWELPPGRDIVVTIESVKGGELTAIGGKKSKKPIISFVGKEKKFVCNVTNSKAIAGMYGVYVEGWKGKRIALFVAQTRDPSTGGDIDCIRVRPVAPPDRETKLAQPATEDGGP